jgi:hypothetical protein
MSERSIYLRDQADKCRAHAKALGEFEMQVVLRKLADEYVKRAVDIEREKSH